MGFGGNIQRERSDAELLAAHVTGDRYTFDELFHRHQRQLHRLARLTTRSPEDAEDALQSAMLSAHRGAVPFGMTPRLAVGCTASWSTPAWTGCGAPGPTRPPRWRTSTR